MQLVPIIFSNWGIISSLLKSVILDRVSVSMPLRWSFAKLEKDCLNFRGVSAVNLHTTTPFKSIYSINWSAKTVFPIPGPACISTPLNPSSPALIKSANIGLWWYDLPLIDNSPYLLLAVTILLESKICFLVRTTVLVKPGLLSCISFMVLSILPTTSSLWNLSLSKSISVPGTVLSK